MLKKTQINLNSSFDTLCVLEVALQHLAWIYIATFWLGIQREDFF